MSDNYKAFKAGTGLGDSEVYFIVPNDVVIRDCKEDAINYIFYAPDIFRQSVFLGTKESCERNLPNYPDCKIVEPQWKPNKKTVS